MSMYDTCFKCSPKPHIYKDMLDKLFSKCKTYMIIVQTRRANSPQALAFDHVSTLTQS